MISKRASMIEASGIRKVFDLAASLDDPINLSIGQPHFDATAEVKAAAIEAIEAGRNSYLMSPGLPELREKARRALSDSSGAELEDAMVTGGVAGGLTMAYLALVDPGDEVLVPDPYFVCYKTLAHLAGGVPVFVDTYPEFRLDAHAIAEKVTDRTKLLILNSPCNPTGVVYSAEDLSAVAELAREHDFIVISDEIYDCFSYGGEATSVARFCPERTLVLNGLSKRAGVTGWRLGFAAGPAEIIQQMIKLQQFTFVCAPSVAQYAALAAMDEPFGAHRDEYAAKRDRICSALEGAFEFVRPDGAFYIFPRAPWGTGTEFVTECVKNSLLVVPGGVFSQEDTHFRVSFAAEDETIDRGVEILLRLAASGPPA